MPMDMHHLDLISGMLGKQKLRFQNNLQQSLLWQIESDWLPVGPFTTVGTGSWSTGQARVNVVIVDPNNAS